MPRQCPAGFRDEMVRGMLDGESVLELVSESGIPMQTLHRWKHQALIDVGFARETQARSRLLRCQTSGTSPQWACEVSSGPLSERMKFGDRARGSRPVAPEPPSLHSVDRTASSAALISAAVANRSTRSLAQALRRNAASSPFKSLRNVRGSRGSTSSIGRAWG